LRKWRFPLAVLFSLATSAVASADDVALRVVLRSLQGGPVPKAARVTITPADTSKEAAPPSPREAAVESGAAVFSVPRGSAWLVKAEAPGTWSRPELVAASGSGGEVAVRLLPAGFLAGEVRVPVGQAQPKELILRFRSAPEAKEALPEIVESCPVADHRFRCALPAGRLDVRIRARGYVSQYRWGITIPVRSAASAGTIELKPGASVVGWIEPPEKGFPFQEVQVELQTPTLGDSPTLADAGRRATLLLKEGANSRGFFEIAGVAPGKYLLVARHPRYAPTRIFPIDVAPGAETEIKRIALEPPATLEVHLDPPIDLYQRPWTVELLRREPATGRLLTAQQSAATKEGLWKGKDLEPGRYLLRLGGAYRSNWYQEELEVSSGVASREIRLPLVAAEGNVTMGGKPLLALLWFGGAHGEVKVATKSDADGHFSLTLPERDKWRVEVSNAPLGIFGVATDVAVHRAPGGDKAHVDIDLPATAVRGDVVDEDGRPAEKARVSTDGPDLREVAVSADGTFEIKGLSPGDWKLQAEAPDGEGGALSNAVLLHLDKNPIEGVHLVLQKRTKLSGLVVGPDGSGVPGARVVGLIEQEARYLAAIIPEASTDVDGQFTLWLPKSTEGLQLTILPPGFAVTQLRVDVRNPQPLVIPVNLAEGTLVLRYAPGDRPLAQQAFDTFLFHDSQLPYSNILTDWASANGVAQTDPNTFTVPGLEPGLYTACFGLDPTVHCSGRLPPSLRDRCVSGQLGAFGELVLKVPPLGAGDSGRSETSGSATSSAGGHPSTPQ